MELRTDDDEALIFVAVSWNSDAMCLAVLKNSRRTLGKKMLQHRSGRSKFKHKPAL